MLYSQSVFMNLIIVGFLIFGQTNVILWFFAIIRDTNISHTYTNDTSMIINDICLSHFVTNNHSIQISEKFNTCAKKSRPFGFLPKPYYSQQNCYCNNSKSHLNDHKKSLERPPLTATKRKLQPKNERERVIKLFIDMTNFFGQHLSDMTKV